MVRAIRSSSGFQPESSLSASAAYPLSIQIRGSSGIHPGLIQGSSGARPGHVRNPFGSHPGANWGLSGIHPASVRQQCVALSARMVCNGAWDRRALCSSRCPAFCCAMASASPATGSSSNSPHLISSERHNDIILNDWRSIPDTINFKKSTILE
jgi:hypothetical protein